ncbi:MAG TPA: hypothetical protein VMZ00_15905 [Sporichthya sp.]|nr:hypothetical protein [Sporichthya sp.]
MIFKNRTRAADTPGMTTRTRRRRTIAAALLLAAAMGLAAAANGDTAPPGPSVPAEIGDAVEMGTPVLLSE